MKKTYIIPEEKIVSVLAESVILTGSDEEGGGLGDGAKTGRGYNSTDATYTKGEAGWATGW